MSDRGLCAVVLAAGEGLRLRPLTLLRPKPLCPVDNVTLLDRTLRRLADAGLAGPDRVAVNACHLADQIVPHVGDRATVSVEPPPALGTGGALALLRRWIDGRDVLVCNGDGYLADPADGGLADLVAGRRDRVRLVTVPDGARGDFGDRRFAGASLLPAAEVAALPDGRSELFRVWRRAEAVGTLDLVDHPGTFLDCGTPRDYLAANLHASGGASVLAPDAVVAGDVRECVLWPGAVVPAGERLVRAIRAVGPDGPLTVAVD